MIRVRVTSVRSDEYSKLLAAAGVQVVEGEADVLLADPQFITAENVTGVTWVQSTWAGVDSVDWDAVPETIPVTNLPGVFGPQIAEFVFGHLLARTQRIVERHATRSWDETLPSVIRGTSLGVMGAGSIGASIATVAKAFQMRVVGCRRSGAPDPQYDRMYAVSELESFASGVDHLVVVLPATPETRHLIDGSVLELLAPGATLINVGRGVTVDLDDVVAAARSGQLGLAVLDVTEPEPLDPDHPAWSLPNVVITGHTAAHSLPEDVMQFFLQNLARFRDGLPLAGQIDRSKGY